MKKLCLGALALVLVACGGDEGAKAGGDPHGDPDKPVIPDACSPAKVCALSPGVAITEYMSPVGDQDNFSLQVAKGQIIQLAVKNDATISPVRLVVALSKPDGSPLKEARGKGGKQDIRLQVEAPVAGVYTVLVHEVGDDAADSHPYTITATLLNQTDEHEPNDDAAHATAVTLGDTLNKGAIGTQGDVDWYSFTGQANQLLQVEFTPDPDATITYKWTLYDASNNAVATASHAGKEPWPVESWAVQAGAYTMKVEATSPSAADMAHPYGLKLSLVAEPDTHEGTSRNDTSATATPLTSGNEVTGYIASTSDQDFYKIDAAQNQLIVVKATMPVSAIGLSFTVLGPDGKTEICDATDGDLCKAFRFAKTGDKEVTLTTAHPALEDGTKTYYVVVRDYQDNEFDRTKSYDLTVTVQSAPSGDTFAEDFTHDGRTSAQAVTLFSGDGTSQLVFSTVTGHISHANDEDWLKFDLPGRAATDPSNGQTGDWELDLKIQIAASPVELQVHLFGAQTTGRCSDFNGYGKRPKPKGSVKPGEDPNQYTDAENAMNITIGKNGTGTEDKCLVMFRECLGDASANPVVAGGPLYLRISDLGRDDFALGVAYTVTLTAHAGCDTAGACKGKYTSGGKDLCRGTTYSTSGG